MATTPENIDILISGGGIAGLTAACVFGAAGFSVLCVDPSPPVTKGDDAGADLRTTAFLQPAQRLLEGCGLWHHLKPFAAPLQIMRIVDAMGEISTAKESADFDASDISNAPFGWNLPNWLLRREMLAQIARLPLVDFRPGVATRSIFTREGEARIGLSDGTRVTARLVIAADGRTSFIRQSLGIKVKTWRYGQKALAFSVSHPLPHENVSTEVHRSGGPFTFVPLPDHNGAPRSAIVWMEGAAEINRLAALPCDDFNAEITQRSCHLFGPLQLLGQRSTWPIISQLAERITSERVALIAEAAHVVPPIGAQGLNMSLGDINCLLGLASANPGDLGSAAMLKRYQNLRYHEMQLRVHGIDALNRASMAKNPTLRALRRAGLKTLHGVTPLRKLLMRTGLGASES